MLAATIKVTKDKMKHEDKINKKYGLEEDGLTMMENILEQQMNDEKVLAKKVEQGEATYTEIAKSKVERKLKAGISSIQASKLESDKKSSISKKEIKIAGFRQKIEKKESMKDTALASINDQIEKLENKKQRIEKDIQSDIESLEQCIEAQEGEIERSENYFRPLIDLCYEDKPIDVVYPTSHFKNVEELKDLRRTIDARKANILAMKAHMFESSQKMNDKWDIQEEKLRKIREQSRREFNEQDAERIAKEEEQKVIDIKRKQDEREAKEQLREIRREEEKKHTKQMMEVFAEAGELEEESWK